MKKSLYLLALVVSFSILSCSSGDDFNSATEDVIDDVINEDPVDDNSDENRSDRIIFVSLAATGNNDGSSWQNAFTNIQEAIDLSLNGDEVWVKSGVYITTETSDRTISINMKDGVGIYGGFNGSETELSQRNWIANETILSGEIGDPNTTADNSFHVIQNTANHLTNSSILDGFIITKGNAGDPEPNERGGGMFNKDSSPTISNCVFIENEAQYGAGIYNLGGSSPVIYQCVFMKNMATKGGGGVYNFLNCFPKIENCLISANECKTQFGGGMYNFHSDPTIINTVISGNKATLGGGMYNTNDSSPKLINTTLSGNYAESVGGGIYNIDSHPEILNSIIWYNADVNGINNIQNNIYNDQYSDISIAHSIIQYLDLSENGNLNGAQILSESLFIELCDPYLAPTLNGDFNLQNNAIVIDAGLNQYNDSTIDLMGNARIRNSVIDFGAIEF